MARPPPTSTDATSMPATIRLNALIMRDLLLGNQRAPTTSELCSQYSSRDPPCLPWRRQRHGQVGNSGADPWSGRRRRSWGKVRAGRVVEGREKGGVVEWLNEPPAWEVRGETLIATAGPRTDFWRTTHYGFVRDNGHLWFRSWD